MKSTPAPRATAWPRTGAETWPQRQHALALILAALWAGCSSSGQSTVDMLPMYNYTVATIHQINTDTGTGPFGDGQRVLLDNVVAVSKVDKYVNAVNQQCRYQIWVQDPDCTTPPCGIVVKAVGQMAPFPDAKGKDCPATSTSGTLLSTIGRGDNARIRGRVVFEPDNVQPYTVVEHQIFVEAIEILTTNKAIAPTVLSDTAMYNQFQTHLGQTWNKYEGMLVTLQPATGVLTVSAFNSQGFQATPGLTDWGDVFDGDYYPSGATMFPLVGSTYRSITGVVSTRHGGELMPGRNKDFVP
ncbi:MAG: hypothetical protein E6Q99_04150 [Elusimicrobia bacterium]|nr:MAG: hypothetical protein E6Q99_04150 [Elusimicrobiota bacterium]